MLSQEKIPQETEIPYYMRDLKEEDAEELTKIFKAVYNGQYPLKEYEDPEWVKKRVDDPNFYWKVCAQKDDDKAVGCGVMILNPQDGRLYGGRSVLEPAIQGQGIMNKIGLDSIKITINELRDRIRIFMGQSRTEPENIAMQRSLEKLGFKPLALMIDFDTGLGERESEIVQALFFSKVYNRRKDVKIIPSIEPFYNVSRRQFPRIGKDYEVVNPNSVMGKHCNLTYGTKLNKYRDNFEIENTVAHIRAEINSFSNSMEILEYTHGHPDLLKVFLKEIIKLCEIRNLKFVEAYVSAYEPKDQQVFLDAGFKIAGYFPSYEVVDGIGEDRIIMVKSPDTIITKGFEFTKRCWKVAEQVLEHMNITGEVKISQRGNYQFYPK